MIPGNHEIADRFGSDNKYFYRMVFGPLYYWFSYGNVMFIGLDSSEERYDDAQLEWLEDVLEKCVRISGIASSIPTCRRLPILRGASRF